MQVLILISAFAISQAAVLVGPDYIGTGVSTQYRSQDNMGNYFFGYNEAHNTGGSFRKEAGSHGNVVGTYGLAVADGRRRIVNYVADKSGFRANIQTNEPGVEPKDPADVTINKPAAALFPAAQHVMAQSPSAVVTFISPFAGYSYTTKGGHHRYIAPHIQFLG